MRRIRNKSLDNEVISLISLQWGINRSIQIVITFVIFLLQIYIDRSKDILIGTAYICWLEMLIKTERIYKNKKK